jgi:hypothetical protein
LDRVRIDERNKTIFFKRSDKTANSKRTQQDQTQDQQEVEEAATGGEEAAEE